MIVVADRVTGVPPKSRCDGLTSGPSSPIEGLFSSYLEQFGHFPMSRNFEQFRRHTAPVLSQIFKHSISTKQGVHV
jgi:hypothetical protein